jgi:ferredoxin-thioredoxin reductase catalytic subunit
VSGASEQSEVPPEEVERVFKKLDQEAESAGYHLNPDRTFTLGLIEGMLVNERRYGYWACPCRLASGKKSEDLDIICPCDYRDADLSEYGACFCALYVSQDVKDGKGKARRIPERRPPEKLSAEAEPPAARAAESPAARPPGGKSGSQGAARAETPAGSTPPDTADLRYPVWRCKVCGYLCARDGPPDVCPICKAKKERFERFL